MWLVSCRRQGMLTQGPAPDPKCKLDFHHLWYTSTFIRFSHLYQDFCVHCIVTMNDGGGGGGGWGVA